MHYGEVIWRSVYKIGLAWRQCNILFHIISLQLDLLLHSKFNKPRLSYFRPPVKTNYVKMGFMDKILQKAEEKIKKKMNSGKQQQQDSGYVSFVSLFVIFSKNSLTFPREDLRHSNRATEVVA